MSDEHPGLKNFSTAWESVKHIGSKALKWAAIGAVALAVLPATVGLIFGMIPGISGLASVGFFAKGALLTGAGIGAAFGALTAVAGLGKELDERKQDAIADYEQSNVMKERAMLRGRGMAVSGGAVAPSAGLGRGQAQGMSL